MRPDRAGHGAPVAVGGVQLDERNVVKRLDNGVVEMGDNLLDAKGLHARVGAAALQVVRTDENALDHLSPRVAVRGRHDPALGDQRAAANVVAARCLQRDEEGVLPLVHRRAANDADPEAVVNLGVLGLLLRRPEGDD